MSLHHIAEASAYIFPSLHWQVLAAGLSRPGDGAEGQVGRLEAMGGLNQSIPTELSVIKSDLHFGEACDAAMMSDAAIKGRMDNPCLQ